MSATEELGLTRRQVQVLERVALGWTNPEIAADMHVVEQTVKYHLTGVFERLGTRSRTEAAAQWWEARAKDAVAAARDVPCPRCGCRP